MELIKPKIKDYPGHHNQVKIDNPDLDFAEAKETCAYPVLDFAEAQDKTKQVDLMQLSRYQGKTDESYPNLECGPGDKPAWIVFAESRGGDLTIDINEGQ